MNKSKEKNNQAGKGDSPRNISKKFWDNYDEISWPSKAKKLDKNKKNK